MGRRIGSPAPHTRPRRRGPTRRRLAAALVLFALPVASAGCASAGGDTDRQGAPGGEEPSATGNTANSEAPESPDDDAPRDAEPFEGSIEDFYVVPDGIERLGPGDLIRYQVVEEDGDARTVRVMYRSEDASGRPRAVTGVVTHPNDPAPEGGWPVVSYGHGTTGMAPRCAPSRDPQPSPTWGIEAVGASSDYVGLGPEGELHPYLSRLSEGNSMIDIVTAAGQLPGAGAGTEWVAVGHSQGGHAALAARELAAERAPELHLAGTVAIAPGVATDESYGLDEDLMTVLTMMQLHGAATERDDIDPADYMTAEALDKASVFDSGCVEEIIDALTGVVADGPFEVDPWVTEPAAAALRANLVARAGVDAGPVLLASGGADLTVVPQRVSATFDRLCELGQSVHLVEVPEADHGSIIPAAFDDIESFLDAALNEPEAVIDDCAS
ncbi:MAG: hypothetical protein M9942_08320 [Microthrixaceae bacterium]|nr:hypothetical protein [Microthrixaceae bacterium]